MATQRRRLRQSGMAIIFYATMLFFVIGCVGLAVDVGTIYMIKARLSSAVDGAALAAGRSVNLANDVATATTNATNTANAFFAANFPTGYFNSLNAPTVTPTFTQETDANGNPSGVLDIQVTASATAPTYFMNVFNVHSINVAATGTASRRGLVLMLVLDQSSSMGSGAGSPCEVMKAAAQNFLTLFSPYDQIGLVTFDITAHLKDSPTTTRTQVGNDIAAIGCGSNTNTISALELAYQQIQNTNLPLALNTIVLFTDGSPNGITANFPARAAVDNRWGPALNTPGQPAGPNPPAQAPANACNDGTGSQDANGMWSNQICVNMPVVCTNAAATFFGTLAQWGDQNSFGAHTYGLAPPTDGATVTIPGSCNNTGGLPDTNIRQYIANIPDADVYGNSLHGVNATSNTGTAQAGKVSRDNWIYQVNNLCSPDPTVSPNCRNTGDFWTKPVYAGIGTGSNLFPAGSAYAGKLRPDQPNSLVAAGMNGTMAEAFRIRSNATFHPVIHSIYLTGNTTDSVDREFLAVVANSALITALPYDPVSFTPYTNPAYQTGQETGKYLVTADRNMLTSLFAQLASELLRLSH
jgi:Flp pilus assembly protein TadG